MTESQARSIVTALLAAYPLATLEPESFELYVTQLGRLEDFGRGQRVVQQIIDESPAFPSIAEFRGVYRRLRAFEGDPGRELEPALEEMPEEVKQWIESIGRDVDAETPLPHDLVPVGAGQCHDCRRNVELRYIYGARNLCLHCTRGRLTARAKLEAEIS